MSAVSRPRIIPEAVLRLQIEASDPAVSAWVAANAGSGKTHVLAQRVIRLLLDGVDPAKILCITFTKAAAANMANRVFDELRRWTALDDAELDAAIRRISDVEPDRGAARAGAAAVCRGAGDARRPQGADHPRLLHAAAAPVSVRGQCRGALRGARRGGGSAAARRDQPRRAARCGARRRTARSAARSRPRSRWPPTRPSRKWSAKRSASATWCVPGSITAAASRRPSPGSAARSASPPTTPSSSVEKEIVEGPLLPASEWAAVAQTLATRARRTIRSRRDGSAAALGSRRRGARRTSISQVFFTASSSRAQRLISKAIARPTIQRLPSASTPRTKRMLAAARAPQGHRLPRPHGGAPHHRRCRDLALPGGEGPARAARLRRPDRQDAGPARRGSSGLGALQARPRHRPRADRRGAGYEPEAMGDHPAADGRILRRRRRARRRAHDLRGRRREAIDLLVPGRGAARVRRHAPHLRDGSAEAIDQELRYVPFRHSFRSGPNVLGAVDKVFERPEAFGGLSADNREDRARIAAGRRARHGRDLGDASSPRTSARSRPGMRRSTS